MRRLNIERMRRQTTPATGSLALDRWRDDFATQQVIDNQLAKVTRAYPDRRICTWVVADYTRAGVLWLHWEAARR